MKKIWSFGKMTLFAVFISSLLFFVFRWLIIAVNVLAPTTPLMFMSLAALNVLLPYAALWNSIFHTVPSEIITIVLPYLVYGLAFDWGRYRGRYTILYIALTGHALTMLIVIWLWLPRYTSVLW